MTDNLLVFGIVLIVASVALGLIAYAFVLNRREAERTAGEDDAPAPDAAEREAAPTLQREPAPSSTAAQPAPLPQPPPAQAPTPRAVAPPPAAAGTVRPPATPIAVIMREDATGRLFLRMGERELRRPEDVRDSRDRSLLEGLLAELNKLAARPQPVGAKPPTGEAYTEAPSRPLSMVEQINNIVERKLTETPGMPRAVRLVEGTAGSVRVYVGVDRYDSVDDVPDADVRRMIREAVAEWEARA